MKKLLLGLLLGFHSLLAAADSAQAALQSFLDGVQSFEAHFTQEQRDEKGGLIQSSSGLVWLARAGSGSGAFRWDYQTPYAQQIISDGQKIWLYDPDLAQVTVRSAADMLRGTPAALLSQRQQLTDAFTLEDAGTDGAARRLRLLPKSAEGDFKAIELSLLRGAPQRMKFFDQLGGVTDLSFTQSKVNQPLDRQRFSFTPPKGVEVVEDGAQP